MGNEEGETEVDLSSINLQSVDMVFMMDTTGSMDSYLEECKNKVIDIMHVVQQRRGSSTAPIRFNAVTYKDYDVSTDPSIRTKDSGFTEAASVQDWLRSQGCGGGGDCCEDVAGGLDRVENADWQSAVRILVWIADAPCHGTHLSGLGGRYDSYPQGDPGGLDPLVLMRNLRKKGVQITL